MRNKILILLVLLFPLIGLAQQNKKTSINKVEGPILSVIDTLNLGEIFLDELSDKHGNIQIKFQNNGNKPLILKNVSGCCGTNVKEWTKAPILPNKEGSISVEFRTEPRPQKISRTVTIESNAANQKVIKVYIVGLVIERKSSKEITL